jgi:hypothetical protein
MAHKRRLYQPGVGIFVVAGVFPVPLRRSIPRYPIMERHVASEVERDDVLGGGVRKTRVNVRVVQLSAREHSKKSFDLPRMPSAP